MAKMRGNISVFKHLTVHKSVIKRTPSESESGRKEAFAHHLKDWENERNAKCHETQTNTIMTVAQ